MAIFEIQKNLLVDGYSWKPNKLIMQPELSMDIFVYRMLANVYVASMSDIVKGRTITIDVANIVNDRLVGSRYQQINAAIDTIMGLQMSLKPVDGKKYEKINIVSKAAFIEETRGVRRDKIQITFNADFVPYLATFFLEGYTKIPWEISLQLKTVPMNKMAELLYRYSGYKNKFTIGVKELHYSLGIQDGMYAQWANFNQRVLAPIHKAINKTKFLQYKYSAVRNGKKVENVLFEITKIQKLKAVYDPVAESIVNEHIWPAHRNFVLDNYPVDYLTHYHNKCHADTAQGKIKNIDSLFFKSVINDPDCYKKKKMMDEEKKQSDAARVKAEREQGDEENKKYNFAEKCFNAINEEDQMRYKTSVTSHFGGEEIHRSLAIKAFIKDYEKELMACESPEEFIRAFEGRS